MRSTRARLAACTALVLSAGMLLAAPASADGPSPRPAVGKPAPDSATPSVRKVPGGAAGRADAVGASRPAGSPQLSDFDGDGYGDLIYRAWDGGLHTATTAGGGGRFLAEVPEPVKDVVPIGDQGDGGGPEVLTLSSRGVLSLYANATPTTASYAWQGLGWQIYNKVLAPGDVNDDGRADLLARDHNGNLYLYYATGNHAEPFSARVKVGPGWNTYDQLLGIGDNNGDGWADLLARDTAGTLWFYAGRGDKAAPFGARKAVGGGWQAYNQIFAVGDDNGDGNGELLARDQKGTLWYYVGKGGGAFETRRQLDAVGYWQGIPQFGGAGNIPVTGDKEGVLARDGAGTLFWYGSRTDGVLADRTPTGEPGAWAGVGFTHLSTLDPDASSDVAWVEQGVLYVEGAEIGPGWDVYDAFVGPGDLTGDGKGDLLARDRSGVLHLYAGNGAGTAFGGRIKVGPGWGSYDRLVGAGDHTSDGRADIVARTPGGDLYLYAGTGSATAPFKDRVRIGPGWQTYTRLVAPGDLNADGKADLLGVAADGTLYRYLNTTSGTFSARFAIGSGFGAYDSMS
ncbi:FG-GAP repeat domain-containing protein [Streptomyces bikiniensis]|uniref:FG-GAP repeat domain-containing protein n=1 Tax=Streptomyces bikiniensis TaxID=1896 RepID=UPI000ABC5567|nr:VCBS repeat-containing protein [Streptomyces bikiniensis]